MKQTLRPTLLLCFFTAEFRIQPQAKNNYCLLSEQSEKTIEELSETKPEDDLILLKNNSRLKKILEQMVCFLEEGDTAAFEYIDSAKKIIGTTLINEHILVLENQINNYDFDKAKETLAKIISMIKTE